MALIMVGDVVASTAALLDDPSQSQFDQDYVLPFLNLRWANLVVNLAMLGLQYSEEVAVFPVPAGTVSLASFMLPGQPLGSLMKPRRVEWKLVGQPDTMFDDAALAGDLDDVEAGSVGILEYAWQGGTVLVTPSAQDVVARVRFDAMSTNLIDPTDDMIRGVGDIIAFRTAELIYAVRGNPLKADMKAYGDTALDDFVALNVMQKQGIVTRVPAMHRGRGNGGNYFVARPQPGTEDY